MIATTRTGTPRAGRSSAACAGLLVGLLALGACATRPPASDPDALADYKAANDPLEPTNRVFYSFDDGVETYVFRPIAKAYLYVPHPVRSGVHNVLDNIGTPVGFADDVLSGNPRRAGDSFMRFVLNTSIGVGGIFDVASKLGYKPHDSSMGTTLALWGVDGGPFFYLPILGPKDFRDGIGFGADTVLDPFTWISFDGSNSFGWARYGLGAADTYSRHLHDIDQVKAGALDPYATFRSLYRQVRKTEIDAARNDHRATVPDWYPQPQAEAPTP